MASGYNPQQWGIGGPTGGAYRPHPQQQATQLTADLHDGPLPSPPPPYTPANNQTSPVSGIRGANGSPSYSLGHVLSATNTSHPEMFSPNSAMSHMSPFAQNQPGYGQPRHMSASMQPQIGGQPTSQMSFPPPPGAGRDRSNSRTRDGQRSLFSLSALRNRSTDRLAATTPPDQVRMQTVDVVSRSHGFVNQVPQTAQRRPMPHHANRVSMYIPAAEAASIAPSARRSASAGPTTGTPVSATDPNGLVLPPPPPGPPPNGLRSMSTDRVPNTVPILQMPKLPTRRPPHRGTALETVPPTPADWIDRPPPTPALVPPTAPVARTYSPAPPEFDTSTEDSRSILNSDMTEAGSSASQNTGSSSLQRSGHRREASIRERRSESRAARDSVGPSRGAEKQPQMSRVGTGRPTDLNLASNNNSPITRQGAVKKPRSSAASPMDPRFAENRPTPLTGATASPAFSPAMDGAGSARRVPSSQTIPLKGLPTPPPSQLTNGKTPMASPYLQKAALQEKTLPRSPYTPAQLTGRSNAGKSFLETESEDFASQCFERFQGFMERESNAGSDRERLELFAEFFVAESRIRRDRYAAAFSGMAAEIFDLTRDLWKSNMTTPVPAASGSSAAVGPTPPPVSRTDSIESYASASSPMSSRANFTPQTETDSPAFSTSSGGPRENSAWANYQPVLSPIPSMAMSAVPDEENSRGRPASRWWESSQGSVGNAQRLERTKRESKYMGLGREARMNLQWEAQDSPSNFSEGGARGQEATYRDFLPEKTGAAAESSTTSLQTPNQNSGWYPSAPNTPDPHKLDVSRLVTLPPPYPRHYPAMNNNHPDLESLRTNLRSLTDLDEIRQLKQGFATRWEQQQSSFEEAATMRENEMRLNIQEQIQNGQMTYTTAAAAENDFRVNEAQLRQQTIKQEFDEFQPEVMSPSHAFLAERITKANACLGQLKAGLTDSAQDPTQNQPQEEGDEQPELLERLNLLKWLFEAKEALHRELYELEGERNERYRKVVTTPMRLAGDQDQLNNAEHFFHTDRQERKLKFARARLKRAEEFAAVVDQNVTRGAEDQLNAFWDIAPGLLAVVQKVPEDLQGFDVAIPAPEYDENPSYRRHPLQYLYSLLLHAEKSAYQFIESQTNLACLLHEAQSGCMLARLAALETQRRGVDGEDPPTVAREMEDLRRYEEARLTDELKDKVSLVESQWREALGAGLLGCKERVRRYLDDEGGWDEGLDD